MACFLIKEIWTTFKSSTKENTRETIKNTLAIAELKIHIETLNKRLDQIHELKQEIDHVDEKVDDLMSTIMTIYGSKSATKQ